MERKNNGQFAKGHKGYNKGKGWSNEERMCKCGKVFNPTKKFQKSCSQHCAMVGTRRRLGKKMSEETKKKLKPTFFSKGFSPWNKGTHGLSVGAWLGKKRPHMTGEKHPQWKGGVTSENEKIRKSAEIKLWKMSVFIRDKFTCQNCGSVSGKINAHHIKPFSKFPELRVDITNGITLCEKCHKQIHKK